VAQRELAEAQAAGVNAAAQAALAQQLREVSEANRQAGDVFTQTTQQTNDSAEDSTGVFDEWKNNLRLFGSTTEDINYRLERMGDQTEKTGGQADKAAKSYVRLEDAAVGAIRQLSGLSAGMNQLISEMYHVDDVGKAFGHNFRDELGKLQLQLEWTNQAIEHNARIAGTNADAYERNVEIANTARKMYLEQAIAATELAGRLKDVTASAEGNSAALQRTVIEGQRAVDAAHLLDQQTLDRLQAAIDAANDKLREMQEETQSAKDRLAELNAEILEAQGEDQKAAILKQQLDYQQQLAEVERQRQEAELAGNRELLALLDEQERKLKTLNDLKLKNIQAEAESAPASSTSASSSPASSSPPARSAVAGKYELKLSGAGKALTAYTDTDPSAFLSALEDAQRRGLH